MSFTLIILAAAKKIGVSGSLLLAICTHESGLNNVYLHHDGGSPTYGVCQIKYETAKMVGFTGEAKELMTPKINAEWAATYLKFQKSRYGGDWVKSTAAYNSGTYVESKKVPGCPKNLQYVKYVQKKLDEKLQDKLSCAIVKVEGSNENLENRDRHNSISTEDEVAESP
jgi:soluble lytic murein transglycosylase-like protein